MRLSVFHEAARASPCGDHQSGSCETQARNTDGASQSGPPRLQPVTGGTPVFGAPPLFQAAYLCLDGLEDLT